MIRLLLFVFSEDFRQTIFGVALRIDRPTMLNWNSLHMTSFAEEADNHLLRSASYKQLSLDLARVQRHTRRTVALFRADMHLMIHHL